MNNYKEVANYTLSVKQPIITLYDLLLTPEKLKLYAAHPITNTRENIDLVSEIENFKSKLYRSFTLFDPTTIDERLLSLSLQEQHPEWREMNKGELAESVVTISSDKRWPIRHGPLLCQDVERLFPIQISADEIVEVIEDVDNQIQTRDYRLIAQSDALVAYRPNLNGKLSTGVYSEMQYARDVAFKPCHMFFPPEDGAEEATPFKGRGTAYTDIDLMISNLERHEKE